MKKYILVFLFSFLIAHIIGMPLRGIPGIGFVYSTLIESTCYAILTYILLRKWAKTKKEVLWMAGLLILGRIILETPVRIIDFGTSIVSLPGTIVSCLTIVLTTLFLYKRNVLVFVIALAAWEICTTIGYKESLYYRTWGTTIKAQVGSFEVTTPEGIRTLKAIKSDYILLDFWSSTCGVCFKKFPDLQALYDKNKDKMAIASVFVPCRKNEQGPRGKSIIEKHGYTFPVWWVAPKDTLLKVLKVDGFPTVIVLDKNRNVIFRGNLERAEKKLENLIS